MDPGQDEVVRQPLDSKAEEELGKYTDNEASTLKKTSTIGRQPSTGRISRICATCNLKIEGGQVVRAVKNHYHLDCFRCQVVLIFFKHRF